VVLVSQFCFGADAFSPFQICNDGRRREYFRDFQFKTQFFQSPETASLHSLSCIVKTSFDHIPSIEQSKRDVFITVILNLFYNFLWSFNFILVSIVNLDIQSLFGLHVHSFTYWLSPQPRPLISRIWAHLRGRYISVSQSASRDPLRRKKRFLHKN
jgi:hypothetical protein